MTASASMLALVSSFPVTDSLLVISLVANGLVIILFPVTDFATLALVFVFEFFVVPCAFVASHEAEWVTRIVGRLLMVRFVPAT